MHGAVVFVVAHFGFALILHLRKVLFRLADRALHFARHVALAVAERLPVHARLARIGAGTDEIMKEIIAKTYGL